MRRLFNVSLMFLVNSDQIVEDWIYVEKQSIHNLCYINEFCILFIHLDFFLF